MDALTLLALWFLLALMPAILLWHHLTRAREDSVPWVFLTLLLGPIGLLGWVASLAARAATSAVTHGRRAH